MEGVFDLNELVYIKTTKEYAYIKEYFEATDEYIVTLKKTGDAVVVKCDDLAVVA